MKIILQRLIRPETPEQFFLFFGFIFSILFWMITPPFQSPDSFQHFYRTYQISEFQWMGIKKGEQAGGEIPYGLKEEVEKYAHIPFHDQNKVSIQENLKLLKDSRPLSFYQNQSKTFVSFPNTILFPPLTYTPQLIGIYISKILNLTVYQSYYFICFIKFLFCFFIFYLSIRFSPASLKWGVVFFSLLPMNIFLLPTLSPDSLITSLGFLIFSLAIHPLWNKNKTLFFPYLFLSTFLSISKIVYFLIPFVLFIKNKALKNTLQLKHKFILILFCILPTFMWTLTTKKLFAPLVVERLPKDPNLQLQNILNEPFYFFEVLWNTLFVNGMNILNSTVGTLGWMDVFLPKGVSYLGILLLILIPFFQAQSPHGFPFSLKNKWGAFLISLVTILMIFTSLFLTATPVGGTIVHGLQGRYFLVLLPFLFILSPAFSFLSFLGRLTPWMVRIGALILLVFSLFAMIDRFYLI